MEPIRGSQSILATWFAHVGDQHKIVQWVAGRFVKRESQNYKERDEGFQSLVKTFYVNFVIALNKELEVKGYPIEAITKQRLQRGEKWPISQVKKMIGKDPDYQHHLVKFAIANSVLV